MNLRELTQGAQYVVKATVTDKRTELDTEESGRIVTYYRLQVADWIKGDPVGGDELVIKQIGQGQFTFEGYNIHQNFYFPEYEVGKTYILFLPEAHAQTGLMAPIGLYQGVFDVREVDGEEVVPQLKSRSRLLKGGLTGDSRFRALTQSIENAGPAPSVADFKSMIQSAGE